MNRKTSIIDGRECFISDSFQPQYILVQTLGNHERGIFDRTAERIADACDVPFVLAAFQVFDFELSQEEMARMASLNQEKRYFNMSYQQIKDWMENYEIWD